LLSFSTRQPIRSVSKCSFSMPKQSFSATVYRYFSIIIENISFGGGGSFSTQLSNHLGEGQGRETFTRMIFMWASSKQDISLSRDVTQNHSVLNVCRRERMNE